MPKVISSHPFGAASSEFYNRLISLNGSINDAGYQNGIW